MYSWDDMNSRGRKLWSQYEELVVLLLFFEEKKQMVFFATHVDNELGEENMPLNTNSPLSRFVRVG